LQKGYFEIGFNNYIARWNSDYSGLKGKYIDNINFLPEWNGLKVKNLLIWGEQGVGDQIFFSRFIPQISCLADNISLYVNPKIKKLLMPIFLNTNIDLIDIIKNHNNYDAQLALGCVPRFIKDYKQVSNICLDIRTPFNDKKVGFSWKSTNPTEGFFRSIQSKNLTEIRSCDCQLVNAQFGQIYDDIGRLESSGNKILFNDKINYDDDIDKVASELSRCSFVITVPNTVAHIAGLLNIKTYLINPIGRGSFWYWRNNIENKNFWYNSITNINVKNNYEKVEKVNEILKEISNGTVF
jgi:hypothetical protein